MWLPAASPSATLLSATLPSATLRLRSGQALRAGPSAALPSAALRTGRGAYVAFVVFVGVVGFVGFFENEPSYKTQNRRKGDWSAAKYRCKGEGGGGMLRSRAFTS